MAVILNPAEITVTLKDGKVLHFKSEAGDTLTVKIMESHVDRVPFKYYIMSVWENKEII